jgi:putative ABC transport system ATP-binding protein
MKPIIEVSNLSKIYTRGAEKIAAVDGIDLTIMAGEFVSFVGPSGSGKTTLLHLLGCLDNPSGGSISVDGREIFSATKSLSEKKMTFIRRDYFGYIFQRFYLIPTLTVKENIMLPLVFNKKNKASLNIAELAKKVGLNHRLSHLPKEISGGEMQRVAIARALINNPKIILADEPTGNLDSKRSSEIAEIMKRLNEDDGITIILVTHNRELAAKATRIVEIFDGKVSPIDTAT